MMDPLIKPTHDLLGPNGLTMEHDETTPPCKLCGMMHVGMLTPCYLMLRGNYIFVPSLGAEVFALDPRVPIVFTELPSGAKAFVVDIQQKNEAVAVMHEDCADMAARKLAALVDVSEEEILGDWTDGTEDDEDDD